jgi:hypothetical protein
MPSNIETVRWFDGQESLPEAGRAVLEDPHLDMVVVRNVGTVGLSTYFGGPRPYTSMHRMRDILYTEIPTLRQLDTTVHDWWDSHPLGRAYGLRTLKTSRSMNLVHRGIGLHIDEPTLKTSDFIIDGPIEGPLTWSLRIDPHDNKRRVFYAKRTNIPYLNENGLNLNGAEQLMTELDRRLMRGDASGISTAEQAPGTMVLFANHPHPTLHAVNNIFGLRAEDAMTAIVDSSRAIVCSYELLHNSSGNR